MNVYLTDPSFSYDVHALVKAFFPSEEVQITGEASETASVRVCLAEGAICVSMDAVTKTAEISSGTPRADVKNILKQTLYEVLSLREGRTLPWGTLSGIRPVRIPMRILAEGGTPEEAVRTMQTVYRTGESRAHLATGIAQREQAVLLGAEGCGPLLAKEGGDPARCKEAILSGYSLYIGIPFCPTICLYCTFPSGTIHAYKDRVPAYLKALEEELRAVAEMMQGKTLQTVYIGGGTPTALSPEELQFILACVEKYFDTTQLLEYTVEAGRPDTITKDHLTVIKAYGVTRISVNPQTMQQKTLDLIGRKHSVEDVTRAFSEAREAGFRDINMDIIVGLPGEGMEEVEDTLQKLHALDPEAITVHSLAIKRSSRLNEYLADYDPLRRPVSEEAMDHIILRERAEGRKPYYLYRQKNIAGNLENIGFSKRGFAGLYNIFMMEELHTVMAAGAGAIAKRVFPGGERIERAANVSDIDHYITRIQEMIDRKRALIDLK